MLEEISAGAEEIVAGAAPTVDPCCVFIIMFLLDSAPVISCDPKLAALSATPRNPSRPFTTLYILMVWMLTMKAIERRRAVGTLCITTKRMRPTNASLE